MTNPISQDVLEKAINALKPNQTELQKAVTTATGLNYYDLQAPAKNLYPIYTPIRNRLPRVSKAGGAGTATNWKQITALLGSGYDSMGFVPEGQRSGVMSYSAVDKAASYRTIGEEDNLTFEAENASAGFEDENARVTIRLLQKMMRKEEIALLAGNANLALGTPSTPTTSASGTDGSISAATYNVIAVALTLEGYKNSSVANGVATSTTITGADGATFTLNGGSSNKSAAASQAVGATQSLYASVPVVNGAVAYAWYVGLAGSEKLQTITTINSVKFTSLTTTQQAATAITADNSRNASLAFDGLLSAVYQNSGSAYVKALATGTAGTGTVLTSTGRGSVQEIDDMLQSMSENYLTSPTRLFMSQQDLKNVTNKVLNGASAPLLRYNSNEGDKGYELTAGGTIANYFNPFAVGGGSKIPVEMHPDLPRGTIFAHCDQLPSHYQSNETPNVAEVVVRKDYYRMDWPLRTRKREYGVYAEEVLAVYAPFTMGIITNIANG